MVSTVRTVVIPQLLAVVAGHHDQGPVAQADLPQEVEEGAHVLVVGTDTAVVERLQVAQVGIVQRNLPGLEERRGLDA